MPHRFNAPGRPLPLRDSSGLDKDEFVEIIRGLRDNVFVINDVVALFMVKPEDARHLRWLSKRISSRDL